MSYEQAVALCEAISRRVGAAVALPNADELECAARGGDGRRYPWGNGLQRLTGHERSPHGIERFVVPVAQWTVSTDAAGAPLAMGGPAAPRCHAAAGPASRVAPGIGMRRARVGMTRRRIRGVGSNDDQRWQRRPGHQLALGQEGINAGTRRL